MQTTVTDLINLLDGDIFDDIAAAITTLEAQSPVYDPNGDISAAIALVTDLRTLSARAAEIANLLNRVNAVKNSKEPLPQVMRHAA